MRPWRGVLLLLGGCAEDGFPDLLAPLTGAWTGELYEVTLRRSPMVLLLGPAGGGATFGHARVWEGETARDYTLDQAWSVEDEGVLLDLFEVGGVRRLRLSALTPLEPLVVGFEATWWCDAEPDRACEQLGIVNLERVEP